jgi:N-acetylneuraminic acid mutarotase
MESLEPRRLLHAALDLHVNFQPAGAPVPAGYFADTGAVFGDRGNGFTYGWNQRNTIATRDRNSSASPDQRYDTLTHTMDYGIRTWEVALPNGAYSVHIVSGDPSFFDSIMKFDAEGTLVLSATQTKTNKWVEATATVNVSDGRLTISNAAGAKGNKLSFIDISTVETGGGTFQAKVNFQPAGAPVPAGYLADTGAVFGDRGNGFSYGWNLSNTIATRDRNSPLSPDQRYDTLTHTMDYGVRTWELAVPDGQYTVHIVSGDPSFFDSIMKFKAESTLQLNATQTRTNKWVEATATVNVTDGRLTISNAAGAKGNKISFIEVSAGAALPVINIAAPDANASESGPVSRPFIISRSGETDSALTVRFNVSGSATAGLDYSALGTSVTIPAGASSVSLNVSPIDDALVEGPETVRVALAPDSAYALGAEVSSTIDIADDDAAAGTKITWTSARSSPIARSEAMTVAVDGKMYVFGGYVDTTFTPTRRVDVFDPAAPSGGSWTRLSDSDMPIALTHAGIALRGRDVIIAGGYPAKSTGGQTFASSAVLQYNLDTHQWSNLPSLPSARGGGALVNVNGTLHFFGGADASRLDRAEHWSLSPGAASWVAKASLLTTRNHLGAVALDGKIYAVGGQKNQDAKEIPQSALEVYNPATNQWTALRSLPFGRSHIAAATMIAGGRIVTIGGETTFNTSVNNVSSYDPGTNTWSELTPLPIKMSSGVAGLIDGVFYYATGRLTTGTFKGVIS